MKFAVTLFVSLFATAAFAAPTQEQVDTAAFAILLKNVGSLATQDMKPLAPVLAKALVTYGETHNKITNSCSFDKGDEMFNCSLVIKNADDGSGETESRIEFQYQLEKGSNGLPSKDMSGNLTVRVQEAG